MVVGACPNTGMEHSARIKTDNSLDRTGSSQRVVECRSEKLYVGGLGNALGCRQGTFSTEPQEENKKPVLSALAFSSFADSLQRTHVREEFGISLSLAEFIDQQFHRFYRGQRVQHFPQYPDA